ncbi:type III pantothenate kinase [Synechococcus sp. M16CYN]|uniref:type III pantothenate kinase n=1 Tax=Synechococcus sp. M16CYN TaxID=3103139 RepID=UPI003250FC93
MTELPHNTRRVLLIGNSRWHWGERDSFGTRFDHAYPDLARLTGELSGWAAVGAVPECLSAAGKRRITLQDVPLVGCPPWLGVDRAIGAWAGWTHSLALSLDLSSGLLLADAGTILSITVLSPDGAFLGGQLIPGYRLQLSAMTKGTEALPTVPFAPPDEERFPKKTVLAMRRGVFQSMVAAIREAQKACSGVLWLCGGDAKLLVAELRNTPLQVQLDPNLQLRGLFHLLDEYP